jgi:hypothetical protein
MTDEITVHRATPELIALALAVRHDWAEHQVSGAITAAAQDGMTWEQALVSLPRLMIDPKAHPRELVPGTAAVVAAPADANALWAGARAEMERQRAGRSAEGGEIA